MGIPLGPTASYNQFIRGQAMKIDQGLADGQNDVQVARSVGCTTRTVRNHKNRTPDKKQHGLFD
ncbi:MAG: hypothetical protein JKY45_03205 [Emcibacter sp.]|nr:hypothetical protein [Emcibacter sp.]